MKQFLFLLLFPCLALAQYQGNANQKITLGEQTTADGLVFRGVALTDTVTATSKITRANKQDTSAYILLDTVTNLLWHYKIGSNAWIQAGGSTLDTATMLLPYYRAGRNTIIQAADVPTLNQNTTGSAATLTTGRTIQTNLASTSAATFNGSANITPGVTGVLPVANGGTNTSTLNQNKVMVGNGTGAVITPTQLHWDNSNKWFGIGVTPTKSLDVNGFVLVRGMHPSIFEIRGTDEINTPFGMGFTTTTYTGGNSSIAAIRVERKTIGSQATEMAFWVAPEGDNPVERLKIKNNGNIGFSVTDPLAVLHLKAGTATAGTAPLKFTSGTNLTTAEAGVMEFNGTNLFFSPSTTRHTVNHGLTGSATLDFLSTNAQNSRDMTIAVTGAADGDVVSLGVPNAAVNANTCYTAWVSAANTVTVRFNNYSSGTAIDPASGTFKVFVTK